MGKESWEVSNKSQGLPKRSSAFKQYMPLNQVGKAVSAFNAAMQRGALGTRVHIDLARLLFATRVTLYG